MEGLRYLTGEPITPGAIWHLQMRPDAGHDLVLLLDGQRFVFNVKARMAGGWRELEAMAFGPDDVLVVVQLTDTLVKQFAQRGVSAIGLNGRVWIRKPGVVLDVRLPRLGRQFRTLDPKIKPFAPRSARLARALLSAGDRAWTLPALAKETKLSISRVSELLNHYAEHGWTTGKRGDWRLAAPDALLDAWAQADVWSERGAMTQYAALEPSPETIARNILQTNPVRLAFTQWYAANLRYPYTTTPVCSLYRSQPLTADEAEALAMRPVSSGGKVWIIVPRDEGVFQFMRTVRDIPVVADVQLYLDLLQVGLRGPDQARALREWSGFRK